MNAQKRQFLGKQGRKRALSSPTQSRHPNYESTHLLISIAIRTRRQGRVVPPAAHLVDPPRTIHTNDNVAQPKYLPNRPKSSADWGRKLARGPALGYTRCSRGPRRAPATSKKWQTTQSGTTVSATNGSQSPPRASISARGRESALGSRKLWLVRVAARLTTQQPTPRVKRLQTLESNLGACSSRAATTHRRSRDQFGLGSVGSRVTTFHHVS